MATMIPEMTITEFNRLKAHQKKRLKSCEVISDGMYLFTFVNGNTEPSGYLRTQVEYLCETSNAVGGESLEEILNKEAIPA